MLSLPLIVSIIGLTAICIIGQVGIYVVLRQQDWFHPVHKTSHVRHRCYEVTVLFLFSIPQYIYLSILINRTPGFRLKFWTNYLYLLFILAWFIISYWIIFHPTHSVRDKLKLRDLTHTSFRVWMGVATIVNGLLMFAFQYFVDWYFGDSEEVHVKEKLEIAPPAEQTQQQ